MIFLVRPQGFAAVFDVAGCYVIHDGKLLLLKRQPHKPQGNTWCIPGGKRQIGESIRNALCREVFEETALVVDPTEAETLTSLYVRYPEFDFVYHLFRFHTRSPRVSLKSDEHSEYQWVSLPEVFRMNLIPDEASCLRVVLAL